MNSEYFKGKGVKFDLNQTFKIPFKVDWRIRGVVSNPKLQNKCGGSWAFASASAFEISHNIHNLMFIEPSV